MSKLLSKTTLNFEPPSITTMDALSGMVILALSVPSTTTLTSMESAARFILNAESSIKMSAFANNAMKAMPSTTVLVKSLLLEIQSTLAARNGMAITTVSNVPLDSTKVKMECVPLSQITAEHGTKYLELVKHVIKDTSSTQTVSVL